MVKARQNRNQLRPRAALRGYSLPFVMGISAMLAFSSAALVVSVGSAAKTSGEMLRRRQAFYACDGLSRVVTKLSQAYMATTAEPNTSGLESYVCAKGGGCPALSAISPNGFDVVDFEVAQVGDTNASTPLPSGPFRGMNARQDTISLKIEARSRVGGHVCRSEQTVTLGKVALFQFYVFSDTFFDGHPGPLMTLNGRAHVNGDACPGGNMRINRVTASGALRHRGNGRCEYPGSSGPTKIQSTSGSYVQISTANDHDTSNWQENALSTWGGNALDEAHDVPELKPPTIGEPRAQKGAHAADAKAEEGGVQTASVSNTGSLRFLIDPVHVTDAEDVKEQKLAFLSDIRIIDGTWYVNDNTGWPGKAIWSDHPGTGLLSNGLVNNGDDSMGGYQVGQATLAGSLGWGTVPQRFSYYGTNANQSSAQQRATLVAGRAQYDAANPMPPGTISYGTTNRITNAGPFSSVYREASRGLWEPGSWLGPELCERVYTPAGALTAALLPSLGGGTLLTPPNWNSSAAFTGYRGSVTCGVGASALGSPVVPTGTLLLNGTRSGIRENHRGGDYSGMARTDDRTQMLPVNFDVMAFQAAMADTSPGELGSYFDGGSNFNGIVWITYTWPGAVTGLSTEEMADMQAADEQGTSSGLIANILGDEAVLATDFPISGVRIPGVFADAGSQPVPPVRISSTSGWSAAPGNNNAATQRELPYALCTYDSAVAKRSFLTGNPIGALEVTAHADFVVPPCANYESGKGGRVNAVRVMNGRNLDAEIFARGLTIATNLPVFVLGDMNTDSQPGNGIVIPQESGARTWIPFLIAGDVMYHVSNNWRDTTSPWSVRTYYSHRNATTTTYNIAELIGWVPSKGGVGGTRFHNLQGFQERWAGVNHYINGAVTIGWHAVYHRNNRTSGGRWAYSPPYRRWTFDTNYRLFSNQPPGTPTFDVAATKSFKRDGVDN